MYQSFKLKKGLDIRLEGVPEKKIHGEVKSSFYGVKPLDFPGLVPRLCVKQGDKVMAGSPLFYDKINPKVRFTSPVSGVVSEVSRGERRRILEVVVERKGDEYIDFGKADPALLTREQVKEKMLDSGLWPVVRQRPYHIIADPDDVPKAIFIPGFDTSPLAPDYNYIMENSSFSTFMAGITALGKLTDGKINLVLDGRNKAGNILENTNGVSISLFSGPHPSGNVGVHINCLDPLNKGEIIWFTGLQEVIAIGRLFEEGKYRPDRIVALTGSEILNPQYYRLRSGSSVREMVSGNVREGKVRFISGNVLTGRKIDAGGYLGYYDSQITVIPEGDHFEFFGWAMPGSGKFSFYRTFASHLLPRKSYRLDTNMNGGERAFVLTGQYEKVVPMDIYPMQLLKAILAEDIDMMENLGIYEIAEEDFALCEYICPSKTEIQAIVRKGLDLVRKEMS
jgi:Na+-transporting NADH:ubiquinone oxidoreductase subunit A